MDESREKLYKRCQKALLNKREETLNGLKALDPALSQRFGGDEADMAQIFMEQNSSISQRERMNELLREIDQALERIETGTYGNCEETEEPIEVERLEAMPWTRLSLEGAEYREAQRKRFASNPLIRHF